MDGGGHAAADEVAVRGLFPGLGPQGLVVLRAPQQGPGVLLQGDLQPGHGVFHHAVEDLGGVLPPVALHHLLGHVPDGADGHGALVVGQRLYPQLDPGLGLVHGLELHFPVLALGGLLQGGLKGRLPLGGAVEVGQQPPGADHRGLQLPPLSLAGREDPQHPVGQQLKQPHIAAGQGGVDQRVAAGHLLVHLVLVAAVADELVQQHGHGGQGVDEHQQVVADLQLEHHRQGHKAGPQDHQVPQQPHGPLL